MSLFQCSQQLTEPIHGRLEIFQDVLRQFLRGGEVVQIGQSLVLDPEDTIMLYLGYTLKDIQTWLGHSNYNFTADTYIHSGAGVHEQMAERFSEE